ncbi:MAG: leucyl aminopeptidase [Nitrosopumilaceae archaeon]
MKIRSESVKPSKKKTAILCVYVLENSNEPFGLGKMNEKIDISIKEAVKEIRGKNGAIAIVNTFGMISPKKILIAGLGPRKKLSVDVLRDVTGKITQKIRSMGLPEFAITIPSNFPLDSNIAISTIVEGSLLSMYSFDRYKNEKSDPSPNLSILVSDSKNAQNIISKAEIVSQGVIYTRSIANLPPNDCPPSKLASFANAVATKNKLKCKILEKNELKKKGFGGISAVGQGSKNEPKLIILEYFKGRQSEKPVVLVGKAVTFDTGGISLKPSDKMDEMKFDKCGGCTVLGIMKAVSELKLQINVVGIIPSVENMPGGESYRPGDIIRLYSGKTAEILNTDAEGRLILADALSFGIKQYSPKLIIDFATLTGACIVALGNNVAGLVSNDKQLAEKIKKSSEKTSEEIWQLPINDDYMDMIKSNVADMKNIGMGRAAGTITAAAFLANAVDNVPWAHIDIAGTAWMQDATKKKSYNQKGATGFGVRLILDYLSSLK